MTAPWLGPACLCLVASGFVACGPAPVPAPPAVPGPALSAAPQPEAASPPGGAATEAPKVALPPRAARPEQVSCGWATQRWTGRGIELRLRSAGPAFAWLNGGRAQLQIPLGTGGDGILDVGADGLVLSGFAAREDIQLYATSVFALNGVVFPGSRKPLSWVEGFTDGVAVTTLLQRELVVTSPPVRAKRPCSDLSLDTGTTLDLAKGALGASRGTSVLLRGGRGIEVHSDPGRPAEATVSFANDTHAQSFASLGGFSRVGVQMGLVYLAGWVKSAHLQTTSGGGSFAAVGLGRSRVSVPALPAIAQVACPADVPVVVEVSGERATAGYITARTAIDVIEDRGQFWRVAVKSGDIQVKHNAMLLVRAADVVGCPKP